MGIEKAASHCLSFHNVCVFKLKHGGKKKTSTLSVIDIQDCDLYDQDSMPEAPPPPPPPPAERALRR